MSTAAAGGLRPGRPDQHYEPPAGGQAITGQRGVVRARQVIVFGTGPNSGVFVYSPTPGLGNLIASITAEGTTSDPYGNTVLAGITEYLKITSSFFTAVQLDRGQITFYDSSSQPGPWTALYVMNAAPAFGITESGGSNTIGMASPGTGGPALIVNGASQLSGSAVINGNALATALEITAGALQNGLDVNSAFTVDGFGDLTYKGLIQAIESAAGNTVFGSQVTGDTNNRLNIGADGTTTWGPGNAIPLTSLSPAAGAGLLLLINHNNVNALTLQNLGTNGGQALLQLATSISTDRALGIQAAGDTSQRVRIDAVPQILMGPGNAAVDCTILRAGPAQISTDGISSIIGNAPEVWHAIGGTGNPGFANGWTNNGGLNQAVLQFRKVAAPYNSVQWVGVILAPAGIVAGQTITGSPSAQYKPNNQQSIAARNITSGATAWLSQNTGGALAFRTGAVAGDVLEITSGNGLVSLDA